MSIEKANSHEEATWRVQNRGVNDRSDAVVVRAGISYEPIDMAELETLVSTDSAGAIITFNGRVRNHDDGNSVVAIDYEAHPTAGEVVERIAAEVAAGSGACKIAIVHRAGHLNIGDIALGAAVSASHRREAFRTLEAAVEQVKMQLPVWKRQEFEDGSHEWTGSA